MALNDIIAKAVAIANTVTTPLQVDVLHYPWVEQNAFGSATHHTPFGEPVLRKGIVEQKVRWRQLPNGNMVTTYAHIIFLTPFEAIGAPNRKEPISPLDKFVLPDGSSGPTVDIAGLFNPATNSPYFAEVWLGGQTSDTSR